METGKNNGRKTSQPQKTKTNKQVIKQIGDKTKIKSKNKNQKEKYTKQQRTKNERVESNEGTINRTSTATTAKTFRRNLSKTTKPSYCNKKINTLTRTQK